jgi:hypothetical protein
MANSTAWNDATVATPPSYVFTEAVLDASEATPEWSSWLDGDTYLTREHVRRYFSDLFGATAETETEMALVVLGRSNMGGGVPLEILRIMARLSKVS